MKIQMGCKACSLLSLLLLAFILPALTGCMAVGPDYVSVEPQAPDKWHTKIEGGLTATEIKTVGPARWWTILKDPELDKIEDRAIKGNLDLKQARARIREARALRGINRANLFPVLDAGGSAGRYRSSENSGAGEENELYSAGFDAGWELDIFGGTRRAIEAAQEDLNNVLVSLLAEVVLNYVEVHLSDPFIKDRGEHQCSARDLSPEPFAVPGRNHR